MAEIEADEASDSRPIRIGHRRGAQNRPTGSGSPSSLWFLVEIHVPARDAEADRMRRHDGFTLIEVLVAVLIIGILAAIAIPAMIGHANRANDAEAKSAAGAARLAMRSFGIDHDGFTGATAADLVQIDPSLQDDNAQGRLLVSGTASAAPTKTSYVVAVKAKKTGTYFAFYLAELGAGPALRFCTPANAAGGCGQEIPGVSFPGFGTVGAW